MKILVLPRDPNPYQELLYREMRRLGVEVHYLGGLTASHTLNLLLLPLETVARRIGGASLVHLHWVFGFGLPGARRFPVLRRIAQVWFAVWLGTCRVTGLRLAWTAHNVLPHEPVFADDVAARRALVRSCDLVLAHSPSALSALAALGAVAGTSAVIPHGPVYCRPAASAFASPASPSVTGGRRFLFFGRVQEYKGVEDLLAAFPALSDGCAADLVVAGQCDDRMLRSRLQALAQRGGAHIALRLQHIPDEEVAELLGGADVVVLPFRQVTTSGTAMLALSHGKPLIVPDLAALADLPGDAVVRYRGGIPALTAALAELAGADRETLTAMSAAARRYAAAVTWPDIARRTTAVMVSVVDGAGVPGHVRLAREP